MKDEKFVYDESHGQLIGTVRGLLQNHFIRSFETHGYEITPVQWGLLNRLWEEDSITQSELVERTMKQKANMTRMLDAMAKKGWIKREPSPEDRRVFLIILTKEGKSLQQKLTPIAQQILQDINEEISENDLKIFARVMNKMKINLINKLNQRT